MTNETYHDQIFTKGPDHGGVDLWTGDVAALAGVTKMTIVRWANDGKVPCSRTFGGDRRFTRADVRVLLAELGREIPGWLREGGPGG